MISINCKNNSDRWSEAARFFDVINKRQTLPGRCRLAHVHTLELRRAMHNLAPERAKSMHASRPAEDEYLIPGSGGWGRYVCQRPRK